jgi:tRNA splicing endonuclease
MSNKNPFEIRAEVLALAKDYMDKQLQLNIELTQKMYMVSQATAEDLKAAMTPYSMDDLMEKAKEMYTFVSKKD